MLDQQTETEVLIETIKRKKIACFECQSLILTMTETDMQNAGYMEGFGDNRKPMSKANAIMLVLNNYKNDISKLIRQFEINFPD